MICMKKVILGLGFCALSLLGVMALIGLAIPMVPELTQWSIKGRVWTALFDYLGLAPIFWSCVILFLFGFFLSIWALFD